MDYLNTVASASDGAGHVLVNAVTPRVAKENNMSLEQCTPEVVLDMLKHANFLSNPTLALGIFPDVAFSFAFACSFYPCRVSPDDSILQEQPVARACQHLENEVLAEGVACQGQEGPK